MSTPNPKIYLLPNLMTAGNLFCGFAATLQIVQGALLQVSDPDAAAQLFHLAAWFILGACIFDVFEDGCDWPVSTPPPLTERPRTRRNFWAFPLQRRPV